MSNKPRIHLDRRSSNVRRILSKLDVDLVDDAEGADLLWLRRGSQKFQFRLKEHQLLNHFPEESAIVDKGDLTTYLHEHDSALGDSALGDGARRADVRVRRERREGLGRLLLVQF